jgi:hypothetical protein
VEFSIPLNTFENHLLSIRAERQKMIHPNSPSTYNERHEKIIEMIDLTMDKYKTAVNTQKMNELPRDKCLQWLYHFLYSNFNSKKVYLKTL